MIFLVSLDEIDALQDVCNIIDPSLRHIQLGHCLVQVETLIFCVYQQKYELFGEFHETIVFTAFFI